MSNFRDPFGGTPASSGQPKATPPGSFPGAFAHAEQVVAREARSRLPWFTPGHIALTLGLVAALAFIGWRELDRHASPAYASVGRRYCVELGKVYAHAYNAGADNLDSGADPSAAIDGVAKSLDAGRVSAYEQIVTPEFAKALPEGKSGKDVTPTERRALAQAWREFAKGMEGGK